MTRAAVRALLLALAFVPLNAAGMGSARALADASGGAASAGPDAPAPDVGDALLQLVNELGGVPGLCDPCPAGANCCAASCFVLSCCTRVCPADTVPSCSCSFGNAECRCLSS